MCPTSEDATHVHLATSSNARTFSTLMTSAAVHCLLEASGMGTTSGVGATPCERLDPAREVKVSCDPYCRAKVHQGPICKRVSFDVGISVDLQPTSPT
jgi:hypothetical protein